MLPKNTTAEIARLERDASAQRIRRWQGPLDERTSEVLTRIYVKRRIEYQREYYGFKANEFEESSDGAFRAGAIIMSVTSVIAAISTNGATPSILHLFTAILPALAAMIASFRSLYQWDKQAQLYRDTILGLQRASLELPDLDQVDSQTAAKVFPKLVKAAESVFYDEVQQWGQIAIGDQKDNEGEDSIIKFADEYGIDIYDADGELDDQKMASIRNMLMTARSTPEKEKLDLSEFDAPMMAARPVEETPVEAPPMPAMDVTYTTAVIDPMMSDAPVDEMAMADPMMSDAPVDTSAAPVADMGMAYTPQVPQTAEPAPDMGMAYMPQVPTEDTSEIDMSMDMTDVVDELYPQHEEAPTADMGIAYTPQVPEPEAPMSDAPAPIEGAPDMGTAYTPFVPHNDVTEPVDMGMSSVVDELYPPEAIGSDAPHDVEGFDPTTVIARQYDEDNPIGPGFDSVDVASLGLPGQSFGSDAPITDIDDHHDIERIATGSDAPPETEFHANGSNGAAAQVDEEITEFRG